MSAETATRVLTPTARAVGRRALGGIVIGAVALVAVLTVLALITLPRAGRDLDPDDATPEGARAVVQVLRDHGVDVRSADSLDAVRAAAADPAGTTVLVVDDDDILTPARARKLRDVAGRLILVQPDLDLLHTLAPGVDPRGYADGSASGCRVGGLRAGDSVRADGLRYLPADPGGPAGSTACLGDEDSGYGLVRLDGTPRVDVLGAREALQNGYVGRQANAAFALGLLGETPRLVWYRPGAGDVAAADRPASLYPGWYTPVAVLLALVAVAAILWRTRRFGPLAVENLPVVVPASETMEGRARLYGRSSARLRALDALRIGTLRRLARSLGMPRTASVAEVANRVAAVLGRPPAEIAAVLIDAAPATDRDLTTLSDELLLLEQRVADAVRPAGAPRGGS